MPARLALPRVLDTLERLHGKPKRESLADPFELVLLENVAYLVDEKKRRAAFEELRRRVGATPKAIRAARPEVLLEIAALGGIHAALRAERLRECAEIVFEEFGGDSSAALALPPNRVRRALQKFPGIGKPGAEKILLLTGTEAVLALDSNALRVLLRLGYGEESRNYAKSYASAQAAASTELPTTCAALRRATSLLQAHGRALCKSNAPACDECPLSDVCRFARANGV
jgi:endonuclease III